MHKSDMKSNPNDRGKGTGGQNKDENRSHQGQDAAHGQPAKQDQQGQQAKQGQQKGQPGGQQQDQQRKERSNQAGDQDVENPNAHRAGASGVMRGPAGNNKPGKGVDDQYDQNEVDDEDVDDTAESSKQKKSEKRHSM